MGREPLYILTDQCPAMKQVILDVFRNTKHRLCMWHIIKKFPIKVGAYKCKQNDFISKIKHFIWGENLNVSEFEAGWKSVVNECNLNDNQWLREMYDIRDRWIPAFFRDDPLLGILRTTSWSENGNAFFGKFTQGTDTLTEFYMRFETAMCKQRQVNARLTNEYLSSLPITVTSMFIEKDAAELYSCAIFYKVQAEMKLACFNLGIQSLDGDSNVKFLAVTDPRVPGTVFKVKYILANNHVECSCKLFERVEFLCSHAFVALKLFHVNKLPRHLVLDRWLKNADKKARFKAPDLASQCDLGDSVNKKINNMWFDFNSCMGMVGYDAADIDFATGIVRELKHSLRQRKGTNFVVNKKAIVENLIGSKIPDVLTIRPPAAIRNKGCEKKRIVGADEKAMIQMNKQKRLCIGCNTEATHDRRSCPLLESE